MSERSPSGDTLRDDAPDVRITETDFDAEPELNVKIGHYTLVRKIESGGMGVVYEAVQELPRRTVAVKVMRAGAIRSTAWVTRFHEEVQLLGRLQHPYIAQIYEGGIHPSEHGEVPFFSMEYIAGAQPLSDYCRVHRLSLRARIELMCKVCEAVEHGHARGIVHRDLKPANILIDAHGMPKVIDFGIARAIEHGPAAGDAAPDAMARLVMGTPQYMSPEQCQGDPDAIDGRCDVYSLGVVLYELLCNQLPYSLEGVPQHLASDTICNAEPDPPSIINRLLRGDIEAVMRRALHKDRDERYPSAQALRDDLQRVLDGSPLQAHRDRVVHQTTSRMRRFARANPRITLLACALIAGVIAWLTGSPPLFQLLGGPGFERMLARGANVSPAATSPAFERLAMVVMDERTDVNQIVAKHGIKDVSTQRDKRRSGRALDALLLRKVLDGGAKVIAFDLTYQGDSEWDETFAAAVRDAKKAGVPVIVAAPLWDPSKESKMIGSVARVAGASADHGEAIWMAELAVRQPGAELLMSLPLAAVVAERNPAGDDATLFLDTAEKFIEVGYRDPPDAEGHQRISRTDRFYATTVSERASNSEGGLQRGAMVASLSVLIPPDSVLNAAKREYGEVLDATPSQLRAWFAGKTVVFGDVRAGSETRYRYFDGRLIPPNFAIASMIDTLQRGNWARLASSPTTLLGALIAAAVSTIVVWVVHRRVVHSRERVAIVSIALAVLVLCAAAVWLSVVLFRSGHLLINPLPLAAAVLCSAALALGAARWSRLPVS